VTILLTKKYWMFDEVIWICNRYVFFEIQCIVNHAHWSSFLQYVEAWMYSGALVDSLRAVEIEKCKKDIAEIRQLMYTAQKKSLDYAAIRWLRLFCCFLFWFSLLRTVSASWRCFSRPALSSHNFHEVRIVNLNSALNSNSTHCWQSARLNYCNQRLRCWVWCR